MSTDELVRELLAQQQNMRDEIAAARAEVAASRVQPGPTATALSPEDLLAARMSDIQAHKFYCPGCGKLVDYQQQCRGRDEAPHPPIEVVSTDELLAGDPSKHTPAPAAV